MIQNLRWSCSFTLAAGAALFGLLAIAQAQNESVRLDVPFVPTPTEVVDRMLELASVSKDDYVIDLGSGDGRIAIAAVRRGATAFGVDLDPERIAQARDNAKKAGVEGRVTFERRNLFETDIGKANVLTMYLLQGVNLQLRPRVLDELKPGSRVVSHAFDMGDWQADQSENINGRRVFMWWVPAKVHGRWAGEAGGRKFTLDLTQQYQRLSGKAVLDGREVPIKEARLRGAEIEVVLDTLTLKGNVSGNQMQGANWRASRGS